MKRQRHVSEIKRIAAQRDQPESETARMLIDWGIEAHRSREAALLRLAADVQAQVEGTPFALWYVDQGVFNSAPPTGPILFQRANYGSVTLDYFLRKASKAGGGESPKANVPVSWSWVDAANQVVGSGSDTTSPLGSVAAYWPSLPG